MFRLWKDDWMCNGPLFTPIYVAIAHLFVNEELKALIQFHRTGQKHFYTVKKFEDGLSIELPEHFQSLDEAKGAA